MLERYKGFFEITPTFGLEVTVENNQMIVQATGQQKVELYAESESKFFMTAVDAQIEFFNNDKGEVEKLVLYQNRQAQNGKKIR